YQMPSVSLSEAKDATFVFQGPAVRRLSAEQFRDALGALTGQWYSMPAAPLDVVANTSNTLLQAKWIWNAPGAAQSAAEETLYLRKEINLAKQPNEAFAVAACDNS